MNTRLFLPVLATVASLACISSCSKRISNPPGLPAKAFQKGKPTIAAQLIDVSWPREVITFAGSTQGYAEGTGTQARFSMPFGVAIDGSGNTIVADYGNHRIRKITPQGVVSTLAGSGIPGFSEGPAATAQFNNPAGVTVDGAGNIYVSDVNNSRIRKITPAGIVSTLAGTGVAGYGNGPGPFAQFNMPIGITCDIAGNVYVADAMNHRIRKITPSGITSSLAGNGSAGFTEGTGEGAQFNTPTGVTVDALGTVYAADNKNGRVRKITPAGTTSTLASGIAAPYGMAIDAGGIVYVADAANKIIALTPAGVATTLAGNGTAGSADGLGALARFNGSAGIAVDANGIIYIGDVYNYRIRKVIPERAVSSLPANIYSGDIASDAFGNIYMTDRNGSIRKITAAGVESVLAGTNVAGYRDGPGNVAQFNYPIGIAVDAAGNVYVSDFGNHRIRKITAAGEVSTVAGSGVAGFLDGAASVARFYNPKGLAVDNAGNIYVADFNTGRIRLITPAGVVSTFAGGGPSNPGTPGYADGNGTAARFSGPDDVVIDAAGNIFVADGFNNMIRKITPSRDVTTYAGLFDAGFADGAANVARFNWPVGLTIDAIGDMYVTDYYNNRIRKITPSRIVSTFAGSAAGFADGPASLSKYNGPDKIVTDPFGNMYVTDYVNARIRKIVKQ